MNHISQYLALRPIDFSRPLASPEHEAEAIRYAQSYGCDIETARRDVTDEFGASETDADAFYTRTEE